MKKSELRKMIKEELLKEKSNYSQEEIGQAMNMTLEELGTAIKRIKNPDGWAETRWKTANDMIDMMNRLIPLFQKMK